MIGACIFRSPAIDSEISLSFIKDVEDEPVRVFLIDDHPLLRLGLRAALGEDIQIVGEGNSIEDALVRLENAGTVDVILLDLDLPGKSGLESFDVIRSRNFRGRIVVLSHHSDAATVERAIAAGADGYFSKEDSAQIIALLLRSVLAGHFVLSPAIQSAMRKGDHSNPVRALTARELEVMRLLVNGFTHREISERLNIAPRTVDFHRQNLKEKLEAESLVDLVRIADRYGLS